MCGIAGIASFHRNGPRGVPPMLAAMRHRGPDDTGVVSDERVALGHTRLSIIDTSAAGHQPMSTAQGSLQIVYNGEMYNYRAERTALQARGYRFQSDSDTEVVLALYEIHGDTFVKKLRGIFALAIYDKRGGPGHERLLLARDPFGIKPLLYNYQDETLVFASELKGLLASGRIRPKVNPAALRQLLSLGSVYQPQTLVEGVKALPSAHYLVFDRRGMRLSRYWSYGSDRIRGLRHAPYAEQVEAVKAALTESVRLQMVADVSVGAFLSGGVDSSLIVAMMAQEGRGNVRTFSVGFEEGANAVDESGEAEVVARHLGTDHTRVLVTGADMAAQMDAFVRGLDQPSVDGANSFFVSAAAATGMTVSLSGTGGDEVFLGYPWFAHIAQQFGESALPLPPPLGRVLSRLPLVRALGRRRASASAVAGERFRNAYGGLYHCFGPSEADELLAPENRRRSSLVSLADDLSVADELVRAGAVDRAGVLCLNGYTRNQLLRDIDACSMTHSLEVRVPFLDTVIVDHALSLPLSSKLRMTERTLAVDASYDESGVKRIICDIARDYLPPEFFSQRAKKGFSLPFADWLSGPLHELMQETLAPAAVAAGGLFDPAAVARVRTGFESGERPWSHPWLLMMTELWRRAVLNPDTPLRSSASRTGES